MPNQHSQQRQTHEELVARFRRAFPPTLTTMDRLASYLKILGGHFISSLSSLYNMVSLKLKSPQKPCEKNQAKAVLKPGEEQQNNRGRDLNFNTFICDQNESQNHELPPQTRKARQRDLHFVFDQVPSEKQVLKQQNDAPFGLVGSKKVKTEPADQSDRRLVNILMNEPPHATKHFLQLHNQFIVERAQIQYQARQQREKEEAKKSKVESIGQVYQKYLKEIGGTRQEHESKGSYKRLYQMMRERRDRVQKRPPKKKVHVYEDAPPIYSVQKVLQVLEMQQKQFIREKRMKMEQLERAEKEIQRQQRQLRQKQRQEQEEKILQQQKQQQRINKERQELKQSQKVVQSNENIRGEQNGALDSSSQQMAVRSNEQPISNSPSGPENIQRSASPSQQQQNSQSPLNQRCIQQISSPPPRPQSQQPRQAFSTPPQKELESKKKENNLIVNRIEQKRNEFRQNPFIMRASSPVKSPSMKMDDLIKKDTNNNMFSKFGTFQPKLNIQTFGAKIFNNNQNTASVTNLFNPNPGSMSSENQNPPQPTQSQSFAPANFNTPHNVMPGTNNQFLQPNQPNLIPIFTPSPTSLFNHPGASSINLSNAKSSFSGSDLGSVQLNVQSGPPAVGISPFLAGNLNPEAARNLFAPNPQPATSLFGPPSQQAPKDNGKAGGRRGKNIRIY